MFSLLQKEDYAKLKGVKELEVFPIIASIIHQRQPGHAWVNDDGVYYILHKCGFSYLYSAKTISDYDSILDFFRSDSIIPQYFHIYNPTEELINAVSQRDDMNFKLRERMRMRGKYVPEMIDTKGFDVRSISEASAEDLKAFNLELIHKFWDSLTDFQKNEYGWIVYDQGRPGSIWHTLAIVNGNTEGDIQTLPEHRGKGMATIAGKYIMRTLNENGINMDWDVFMDNIPSIKIGEGFGYKPYLSYKFLSIFKK